MGAVLALKRRALQTGTWRALPAWGKLKMEAGEGLGGLGGGSSTATLSYLHTRRRCWESDPKVTDTFSCLRLILGQEEPSNRVQRSQKEAQTWV